MNLKATVIVAALMLPAGALALVSTGAQQGQQATITVYKSPTCGCCAKWVDHMRAAGFKVETKDMANLEPVKLRHGVPGELESCHTGVVNGYVFEGHIPADVIKKFLAERPRVKGLAVPGMPAGSPGMEGMGVEHYDILAFDEKGKTTVYAKR